MLSTDDQKFRRLENEIARLKGENENLRKARDALLEGFVDVLKLFKPRVPMSFRDSLDMAELITKLENEKRS